MKPKRFGVRSEKELTENSHLIAQLTVKAGTTFTWVLNAQGRCVQPAFALTPRSSATGHSGALLLKRGLPLQLVRGAEHVAGTRDLHHHHAAR